MGAFLSSLGSAAAGFGKNLVKKNWDEIKGKTTPSGGQDANPDPSIQNAPASNQEELPDTLSPLGIAYHAEGGKLDPNKVNVVGEKGPEAIVGDRVFSAIPNLYHQARALVAPDPSIDKSLMEKEQNIENYNAGPVSTSPTPRTAYTPPMNKSARYGDKLGEERIDTTEMTKPLGELPKRAEGGPIESEKPYVVGEDGPEVIVPDQNGTVIPNDAQAAPVEMASATPPATATGKPKMQALGGGEPPQPKAQGTVANPTVRGAADIVKDSAGNGYTKDENGNWVNIVTREPHSAPAAPTSQEISAASPLGSARGTQAAAPVTPTPEQIKAQSQVPATNVHTPQELAFQRSIIKDKLANAVLEKDPMKGMMDTIIAEKQQRTLNAMNPYGSEANHPGILGKIEHGLAAAGNIAGNIVAPGTMANIPGTAMNQEVQAGAQDKQLASLEGEQADIALKNAQAIKATTDAKPLSPKYGIVPGVLGPNGELIQTESTGGKTAYVPGITGVTPIKPPSAGDDRIQFVKKWLADKKLPDTAENELLADGAYTDATQKAPIAGVAPTAAGGQTAFTARPGEKLPAGAQPFALAAKDADKWVTWRDDKGEMQYGQGKDAPQGAQLNEVDPKTFPNEIAQSHAVQDSVNNLWRDVYAHPEIFNQAGPRAVLDAATANMDTQFGALVAGTGGSIKVPETLVHDLQVALQNHTMDKAQADAVKDYITDLVSAKDKALAIQQSLQGGKIGRANAQAFKAVVDQMPSGATPDSKQAKRKLANLQQTIDDLSTKYPESFQGKTRAKAYVPPVNKLEVGDIQQGHVYKGGDAHDPANWEKQ